MLSFGSSFWAAHTQRRNERTALSVMTETLAAANKAAEIAAVVGIKALFVGPNDLLYSMSGDDGSKPPAIERALRAIWGLGSRVNPGITNGAQRLKPSKRPAGALR